jgi:hypothetical protein
MNKKQFFAALVEYYGEPKRDGVTKWLIGYLDRNVDLDRLALLFDMITRTHSEKFGFPSIKEIEDAIRYGQEQKEGAVDLRPKRTGLWKPEAIPEEELMQFDSQGDMWRAIMEAAK